MKSSTFKKPYLHYFNRGELIKPNNFRPILGGFMPGSEMGESRGYEDYEENGDSDWVQKEPMIKFKDLEDEEDLDREVSSCRPLTNPQKFGCNPFSRIISLFT